MLSASSHFPLIGAGIVPVLTLAPVLLGVLLTRGTREANDDG